MFVSLSQSNDPFAAQLNALQKDAMGVGDLPVGMRVGGAVSLSQRAPSWNPSQIYGAGSVGAPLGVV
eukprot:CAMPEP_0179411284 /NCGR_PEP_ID=MMETSP0799-20121207/3813_1 /TAXON_ID=46947 /ORGANISM="Geminigera cryophila, Strain CCMP2564" /LENGTH=66 /DNA_ID=CAMNT_0021183339 /DNA_START=12 /DNA_END=212 /DNA_ORIENTATION=+